MAKKTKSWEIKVSDFMSDLKEKEKIKEKLEISKIKKDFTCISVTKEKFWKLMELKVKLRCSTWDEFIEKIYPIILKNIEKNDNSTGKTSDRK